MNESYPGDRLRLTIKSRSRKSSTGNSKSSRSTSWKSTSPASHGSQEMARGKTWLDPIVGIARRIRSRIPKPEGSLVDQQNGGGRANEVVPQSNGESTSRIDSPEDREKVTREALERRKLELEVERLNEPLYVTFFRSLRLIDLTVFIVAFMSWKTGVFSVTNERLTTQKTQLEMQKVQLESERSGLQAKVDSAHQELAIMKKAMECYDIRDRAIKELSKLNVIADVGIIDGGRKFSITFGPRSVSSDDTPQKCPDILNALEVAAKIDRLTQLEVNLIDLGEAELSVIGAMESLEFVRLRRANVTDSAIAGLKRNSKLKTLMLDENPLTTLGPSVHFLPSLETLIVPRTNFSDDGLKALRPIAGTLSVLFLSWTTVTDAGFEGIEAFNSLETIFLEETNVSIAGVRRLAELPKIKAIDVRLSESEELKELKMRHPGVKISTN